MTHNESVSDGSDVKYDVRVINGSQRFTESGVGDIDVTSSDGQIELRLENDYDDGADCKLNIPEERFVEIIEKIRGDAL